jgi:hypothetical protein
MDFFIQTDMIHNDNIRSFAGERASHIRHNEEIAAIVLIQEFTERFADQSAFQAYQNVHRQPSFPDPRKPTSY